MYLEKDAIYRIRIPDDDPLSAYRVPSMRAENVRAYWNGRLVRYHTTTSGGLVQGTFVDEKGHRLRTDRSSHNDYCYFTPQWIESLVRHCPQVEHYIATQQQEQYVSPFDGKAK